MSFEWGTFGPKAKASLKTDARVNVWEGSVRSGKTIASLVAFLGFMLDAPEGKPLLIGKTERTLKRNILDPLAEMLGSDFTMNRGEGEVTIGGRRCYIAGANDARAEEKIRGGGFPAIYGDELTLWPEELFAMCLSRMDKAGARMYGTTNPDAPTHWLKANYLDRADELGWQVFAFRLDDNPNLDPAYVAALKREYVGLWYRRFVEGEWVAAEGAVYGFLDDTHAIAPDELPGEYAKVWAGGDYGTTNPTAFVALGLSDGVAYAFDEHYFDGRNAAAKTDQQLVADLAHFLGGLPAYPANVYLDPSAASFILQANRDGIAGIRRANNDVLAGIQTVSRLLGSGKLRICRERCPMLWKQLTGYRWDAKATDRGTDRPLKVEDHAADALRYVCHSALSTLR